MDHEKKYQFNLLEKILLRCLPPVIAGIIKLWNTTCRVEKRINEAVERTAVKDYNGAVYATWHQRMFYFFHDFGSRHVTMMISRSKDGEYANEVALRLGFYSVRGSATRNGRKAMHELIEKLQEGGHTAGMMADGPQGPPRVLKMGTVRIARETGRPIIPMMYGAQRKIVFKSWDRYFLPVPFTRVVLYHGDPFFVPLDADEEECERIRRNVEQKMNEMADFCDAYWGGRPVGKPGYDLPEKPRR
ncbi:MAG: lysophospholipid acyltransferase family protein [Desulfomonilia bacterium]